MTVCVNCGCELPFEKQRPLCRKCDAIGDSNKTQRGRILKRMRNKTAQEILNEALPNEYLIAIVSKDLEE
jgi:hypothetical protein